MPRLVTIVISKLACLRVTGPLPSEKEGNGPVVRKPDFSGRSEKAFRPHSATGRVGYLRNAPRVIVAAEAFRTMLLYVERAPLEVGWQGTAVRHGNDFIIDRVYLLKQTVSASTTDLTVQGRGELCMELLGQGAAGIEAVNNLRFWGHSHVRMAVEASGPDENTMREFEDDGLPWAIRGIFNKLGRGKFSLFLYKEGLRIDDVPWVVVDPGNGRTLLAAPVGRSWGFGSECGWKREPFLSPVAETNLGAQPLWQSSRGIDQGAGRSPYDGLPPELIPDENLRAIVSADYQKKVDESASLSLWSRIFGDDSAELPVRRNFGDGDEQVPSAADGIGLITNSKEQENTNECH